jgi:hypothetical protein
LWATVVVGACVAGAALVLATFGGGVVGTSAAVSRVSTENSAMFRAAIMARLRAQHLAYQWIARVPSGRRFDGEQGVRCNVDFGIDPHAVAYCSVLRGGRLLTSEQDRAIPCGEDNAGYSATIIKYG